MLIDTSDNKNTIASFCRVRRPNIISNILISIPKISSYSKRREESTIINALFSIEFNKYCSGEADDFRYIKRVYTRNKERMRKWMSRH